jgi:hypothetical protein
MSRGVMPRQKTIALCEADTRSRPTLEEFA